MMDDAFVLFVLAYSEGLEVLSCHVRFLRGLQLAYRLSALARVVA